MRDDTHKISHQNGKKDKPKFYHKHLLDNLNK